MKNERQQKITEILKNRGWVTVKELSGLVYASEPTVRRDLAYLSNEGLVRRAHGGACGVSDSRCESPFGLRADNVSNVKMRMCRAAAALVHDGDTVFIDGSTSCLHIADYLDGSMRLTAVTNSVMLAGMLEGGGFDVYCTGGRLIKSSLSYAGARACEFAGDFRFDIMFFSARAIGDDGVITDYSLPETQLRRRVMQLSKTCVMLCDKSKFSRSSAYFTANASDIDILITDASDEFEGVKTLHV